MNEFGVIGFIVGTCIVMGVAFFSLWNVGVF